jgi:hypothetical protein
MTTTIVCGVDKKPLQRGAKPLLKNIGVGWAKSRSQRKPCNKTMQMSPVKFMQWKPLLTHAMRSQHLEHAIYVKKQMQGQSQAILP